MARKSIIYIVLGWRETEPRIVHCKSNLVRRLIKQLWIVLHHALEACRCFKLGAFDIGVLRVDKLGDYTTATLKRINIVWNLKYESVCVTRERRVS